MAAPRSALVTSSSLLHARTTRPTSPYSLRFLAMLFLDFRLSVKVVLLSNEIHATKLNIYYSFFNYFRLHLQDFRLFDRLVIGK